MSRAFLFFSIFIFSASLAFAQLSHADKLYSKMQYVNAIQYYKRAAHGKNKEKALLKLADCYRFTKDYVKAEQVYGKLIAMHSTDPMLHFNYGEVLLNNKKYSMGSVLCMAINFPY